MTEVVDQSLAPGAAPPPHSRSDPLLEVHRPPLDDIDWPALDAFGDRVYSQRRHWLEFIAAFTDGEVVVVELHRGAEVVGYFSGIRFRRCGIPILGSPFRGWTTPYMGFNLVPGVSRIEVLGAVEHFAFRALGCLHLEVTDRQFTIEDGAALGYAHRLVRTLVTDLTQDEDRLLGNMSSPCRRAIRKAEKSGVIVEPADPKGFAEEYGAQLQDVFAKQDLRPTYSHTRVQKLIDHVYPSGDLLLARVRDPEGRCIATGIFPGFNHFSFFWGNGSLREHQSCARTKRCTGSRCAIGSSAACASTTGAAPTPTRKNTASFPTRPWPCAGRATPCSSTPGTWPSASTTSRANCGGAAMTLK
jgi:hypothetical protein